MEENSLPKNLPQPVKLPPYYHHKMSDAARLLGVSRHTLDQWVAQGRIVPVSVGSHYRILESELQRFGAKLQNENNKRVCL